MEVFMSATVQTVPILQNLPDTLTREGAIAMELEQGFLVFRVASLVQERIESLLDKQRETSLSAAEEQELQQYEEVDDYLSFLNRLTRNLALAQQQGG
jgi:hypothetical protein